MNDNKVDPAALAGAALAAVLVITQEAGAYSILNSIVGGTLLLVLIAYQHHRSRSIFESLAFSAVCALCAVVALGYLVELLHGNISRDETKMTERLFALLWLAASAVVLFIDRFVFQVSAKKS